MKKHAALLTVLFLTLLLTITGCSGNKEANIGSSDSVKRETVFALYNKVQLDQDKAQIDAALGSAGEENSSAVKSYRYMDENHEFGVEVIYDEKQQAIAKTAVYPTHKDIASFIAREVTEAEADKIQKGMQYGEVKELLGGDGVEVNATEIPFENNKISYMYRWANNDGSCVQVVVLTDGTVGNALFFDN